MLINVDGVAAALQEALPGHVQRVVRCITQLATACTNHAGKSWVEWQPPLLASMLTHLVMQQQHLKQYHVASVLKDVTQVRYKCAMSNLFDQGLFSATVLQCVLLLCFMPALCHSNQTDRTYGFS